MSHHSCRGPISQALEVLTTFLLFLLYIYMYIYIHIQVGGFNPSEKILVSWDDFSQQMESHKNVPNHQPVFHSFSI